MANLTCGVLERISVGKRERSCGAVTVMKIPRNVQGPQRNKVQQKNEVAMFKI